MVRKLNPEKRTNILNSALTLFVRNGVKDTSTAEIAKEAGIATGTLFLYFPTKLELINALVLHITKEESEHIYSLLDPTLSVRDTFYTIWDGSIHWLLEHIEAYQYSQQIRDSGLNSEAVSQESGKHFGFYYETIQKGLDEGSIKPYPVDLIGSYLYQDIVAVMSHLLTLKDPAAQEEAIKIGFAIFWDGIKI